MAPTRELESLEIHHLDSQQMEAFLERRRATFAFSSEMNLAENLAEILRKANEFVPSSAGSILLDNPLDKHPERQHNRLTFVAAFGDKAPELIGQEIPADQGIAGRVYITGEAHHASNAEKDAYFFDGIDQKVQYKTHALVAIPIRIEQEVCGVLELINRQGAIDFSDEDKNLLQIFAGYIAISIQNILDGRRAQELAKRDNLTGLFNDHYLHVAMERSITACLESDEDLAVIFLDLPPAFPHEAQRQHPGALWWRRIRARPARIGPRGGSRPGRIHPFVDHRHDLLRQTG